MNAHEPIAPAAVSQTEMANAIRFLAMDAVEQAKSGHPGMPMGMADVAAVLFTQFLKIDPASPSWPDRDRFVLSAGHGSMLLYALHHLLGYTDMPVEQLKAFRQLGARTAGHPEFGHALGIETTTGPLGQGITTAVGMALAERMMNARFGDGLVDHHTYAIVGDGCLMEGISHEAIDMAGCLGLGRLIVLWDDNSITIDGATALSTATSQPDRFAASGWHVQSIDGHDPAAISAAIAAAKRDPRPSMIACKTIIGKGAPTKQGSEATHGAPLGAAEIAAARAMAGWSAAPFEIPAHIMAAWRAAGERSRSERKAWLDRLRQHPQAVEFRKATEGDLPPAFTQAMADYKLGLVEQKPNVATRKASEMALAVINAAIPNTIGGSADLTHSNLTITKGMESVARGQYGGRYIRYGIREHGMAAAMNGIALHGGFIPYGGTFLVFSDYARGAIRLSALMQQRVIYVLTHDSIGLGEDGPTHQPVEHLAMLRATPNLNVFRPCDAVETAEAWEIALETKDTPSALCLSRQNLPVLRREAGENRSRRGAYILRDSSRERHLTLLATGSEVEIACRAAEKLEAAGMGVVVVSMPCWELFEAQDDAYRHAVLGNGPRIAIEAACRMGWDRWIGERGAFIGMNSFGASAPAPALYSHFGITDSAIIAAADRLVG
jgi:transketolase